MSGCRRLPCSSGVCFCSSGLCWWMCWCCVRVTLGGERGRKEGSGWLVVGESVGLYLWMMRAEHGKLGMFDQPVRPFVAMPWSCRTHVGPGTPQLQAITRHCLLASAARAVAMAKVAKTDRSVSIAASPPHAAYWTTEPSWRSGAACLGS